MKWKKLDLLLIILSLSITLLSVLWILKDNGKELYLYVKSPEGEWYYDLSENRELQFNGPLGVTSVTLSDQQVWVTDSPCENKICINAAPLHKYGSWNACLPNRIFLSIDGEQSQGGLDDQSY